jgi:hypothetical protein
MEQLNKKIMIPTQERVYLMSLGVRGAYSFPKVKDLLTKIEGVYVHEESRKRAQLARSAYSEMKSHIRWVVIEYERNCVRRTKKIPVHKATPKAHSCLTCNTHSPYGGRYHICPVCLEVYNKEFRDNFLESLDSCEALSIIDTN